MMPSAYFATIVIDLNPNVARLGPLLITWHGVFSVIGIIAAARVGQYLLAGEGISGEQVYDMAVWMVVAGIIGARLLYVWENYQLFVGAWQKVVFLNEGGISQWGGIFGGLLGGLAWSLRHGIDYRKILDAVGPANALGFAIGRIGDVINGEHHAISSNLPFAVEYVNPETLGQPGRSVHLEVGYELLWNLLVFAVALLTYRRLKLRLPTGVVGLLWLAVYSFGRFWLSFLREDSLLYGLRQAQWASLAMILAAAVLSAVWLAWEKRSRSDTELPTAPTAAQG
ncbi:MAG: prolipoprotein diacylglyceryl transferase [Candidatus Dormibacteraeota bacterium]|nr:prolipoprotein diacylglyceryl transferase [Candidatus Dormibacteraeota bacterium]